MDTLDLSVAQAIHAVRLLERALHDDGEWSMDYAGQSLRVTRLIHRDHIHMIAMLPAQCWLHEPDGALSLLLDGEVQAVRQVTHPGDGEHRFDWTLGVRQGALRA